MIAVAAIFESIDGSETRVKRDDDDLRLNVRGSKQPYVYDCAPTSVQCILLYFGVWRDVVALRNEIQTFGHQRRFNWGEPRSPEGSTLENVLEVLNNYISSGNLNQNRRYRITYILFGMRVDELIRESLRQNMPLIIAANAHVRVINGIRGNVVTIMDPADGEFHDVDYDTLMRESGSEAYLIHYNSGASVSAPAVETMELCLGTSLPIPEFPSCFLPDFRYSRFGSRRKRRSGKLVAFDYF